MNTAITPSNIRLNRAKDVAGHRGRPEVEHGSLQFNQTRATGLANPDTDAESASGLVKFVLLKSWPANGVPELDSPLAG